MSKNGKRKKNLLKKFETYKDEELLIVLSKEIPEYQILLYSEEMAKEILSKYGIEYFTNEINKLKKQKVSKLLELATLRNISIPEKLYDVKPSEIDLILRIQESELDELRWIDTHNYLFDLGEEDDCENIDEINENIWPSDIEKEKVIEKYNNVFKEEFGENITYLLKNINIDKYCLTPTNLRKKYLLIRN